MPAVNLNTHAYDVRIDRKTKWGNKFWMRTEADRARVIREHKAWLWVEIQAGRITVEELAKLKGLKLGCHCFPKPCHGDTLSAAADWAYGIVQARKKL